MQKLLVMSESESEEDFHVPRLHEHDDDSDKEIEAAFTVGKLEPGIFRSITAPKPTINNKEGLLEKLEELKPINIDWLERLDVAVVPKRSEKLQDSGEIREFDVHNDFQREISFYEQAKDAVLIGLARLHKADIKTTRPDDYFAEMAKKDDHMKQVRSKLLNLKRRREQVEKNKMEVKLKKYSKQVQQAVLKERQKKKKEMLTAVKKYQEGKSRSLDFLEEREGRKKKLSQLQQLQHQLQKQKQQKLKKVSSKRAYKNSKFGYGGRKKRSKWNTKESHFAIGNAKSKKGKPTKTNKRLGKSRRAKMKSKA